MTREVRTVLLYHDCGERSHYDWMVEDPRADAGHGPLLTWRITEPSERWAAAARVVLERIGDHRREYLSFEGELSSGRGIVRRVDEGVAKVESWTDDRGVLDLTMKRFSGRVELGCLEGKSWEMRIG